MCGITVDIQAAMAEIRREKEEDRKMKPQGKNKMSTSATQSGHKNRAVPCLGSGSTCSREGPKTVICVYISMYELNSLGRAASDV